MSTANVCQLKNKTQKPKTAPLAESETYDYQEYEDKHGWLHSKPILNGLDLV